MSDTELAAFLNLTPGEAAIVLPQLSPKRRAAYTRLRDLEAFIARETSRGRRA